MSVARLPVPNPPDRRRIAQIAAAVIASSHRDAPADKVLATQLKAARDVTPDMRALVSQSVFAYYRWFGWLDAKASISEKIQYAVQLAERFARQPQSFHDDELVKKAVPGWLAEELEVTPDWVRALQSPPRLWLRARPGQGKALAQKLGDCRLAFPHLAETLEYNGKQDLFRTSAFHTGEFEMQDLGSQAVSLSCAPKAGESWWDACAGEGGKLLHLSDLMQNRGLIWASDRVQWRLDKLKRRAARAGAFNYRAALWDGGTRLPTKGKFDGILIDAPCSGVGTWQRNPQARWTLTRSDVAELKAAQVRLLTNAAVALKAGGKLIYAVCTLTRSETVGVAEVFEREVRGFARLELKSPLAPAAGPAQELKMMPQQFGGNGMFIIAWTRTAAG